MRLSKAELINLLEYVPRETCPELHKKILGNLTAVRYYEATRGTSRKAKRKAEEDFIDSLSEYELEAWQDRISALSIFEE